jgi:hypothetical protein
MSNGQGMAKVTDNNGIKPMLSHTRIVMTPRTNRLATYRRMIDIAA